MDQTHVSAADDDAAAKDVVPEPSLLGGRYRLDRELGAGGMGSVHVATHIHLGKPFALKLIRADVARHPAFAERFKREAEALGRLDHPNIVHVTDYGIDGGVAYLVMELLNGVSLADYIHRERHTLAEVADLLEGVARGLDYAHARGVLHRDLKPANVFVTRLQDGSSVAKIVDFGLARLDATAQSGAVEVQSTIDQELVDTFAGISDDLVVAGDSDGRLTRVGSLLGTAPYMAPELFEGFEATTASDIYALGTLTFEAFTRKHPYSGSALHLAHAHAREATPVASKTFAGVPPEVDEVLAAMLAKDPEKRPRGAVDTMMTLRRQLARAEARSWREREIPKRRKVSAVIAAVATVASLAIVQLPLMKRLDAKTIDYLFAFAPPVQPSGKIMLVTLGERALATDARPLAERADDFAAMLEKLFAAGAKHVAVDFLFPMKWRESFAFTQALTRHHEKLSLAALATPDGDVIGPEALSPLVRAVIGDEAASRMFAWANVEPDGDGVLRTALVTRRDRAGHDRRALATAVASAIGASTDARSVAIDSRIAREAIPDIEWNSIGQKLAEVSGKGVILGASFAGSGDQQHRIRGAARPVGGNLLHAIVAESIARDRIVDIGLPVIALISALASFALAAVALTRASISKSVVLLGALSATYAIAAELLFLGASRLMSIIPFAVALLLSVSTAFALRRRMSEIPSEEWIG